MTESERKTEMVASEKKSKGHALVLPYPSQGHINPMLQFGKRIASHGRLATAAITRFIVSTTTPNAGHVAIETISDGFDDAGFASNFLTNRTRAFTDNIYPATNQILLQEMNWLASVRRAITIGPTIPSVYLDNRIPDDHRYAIDLFRPETSACKSWIASLPPASAIFVSFGSMATLSAAQFAELAFGLAATNRPFLWVVRSSEKAKLPPGFPDSTVKKNGGMLVSWAPQLELLASGKFGCFVTHCGWNSTIEGLGLGVAMVGLPQWTDQCTDARLGEWKEASRRAMDDGGSSDRNITELLDKFC
ncbi:UDP-glycosyltransferase 74B1-like [Phalaenopsis equestris]|uniref:UDP-glycosyltransferase 74B1-like n=1 Tax=Phalaenopsis equestris TaxID=78828 RepID=UPI0009E4D484|nr:UDP-glycosyltransferase 74B1-like [Phalaenopsis equestris]